jgi:hypothetical protein
MTKEEFIDSLGQATTLLDESFNATGKDATGFVLVAFAKSNGGFMCTCTTNSDRKTAHLMLHYIAEQMDSAPDEPRVGHA